MRTIPLPLVATLVLALQTVLIESSVLPTSTSVKTGQYCAQRLIPNDKIGLTKPECFTTKAAALAVATGDSTLTGMDDAIIDTIKNDLATKGVSPFIASTEYILAEDYWDTHYNGNSYIWYSSSPCSPYYYMYITSMPSTWNDEVSSARSYVSGNCSEFTHYEHANGGGKTINCGFSVGGCYDMWLPDGSSMSDRTSSELLEM